MPYISLYFPQIYLYALYFQQFHLINLVTHTEITKFHELDGPQIQCRCCVSQFVFSISLISECTPGMFSCKRVFLNRAKRTLSESL